MPLALRRSQLEIKYAVKVKATECHPSKTVTEFYWTTLSKKNLNPTISLAYISKNKTQLYFLSSPAENVQAPVLPEEAATWHQKSCSVDSSLKIFWQLMKKLALEKIDSYTKAQFIYLLMHLKR